MDILSELYSNYSKDIFRYLFCLCHDASLAEELTSEVFLEVVKSIGSFRAESDIKTWLFTIARRKLYQYLHRTHQQAEWLALSEFEDIPVPDHDREIHELAERVHSLIILETERIQTLMEMRFEGYSFCEIGKALSISESSARVLYHRTRDKIRKKLKEEGYTYE